jgi:hypothetical protein
MRPKKNKPIKVNICWEVGEQKKCVTLDKDEAYATKEWVDKEGGVVFWFQPIEN